MNPELLKECGSLSSSCSRRGFVGGLIASALLKDSLQAAPKTKLWIGYSVVNYWHLIDPSKLGALLAQAGCTFTEIEYVPWFNEAAKEGKSIETNISKASKFVAGMRKHGITTFISLVNWNGESQRQQEDRWFHARVNEIQEDIGTDRVMLLGVSEPDGQHEGKAYRWSEFVLQTWKGLKVGNGDGGRGEPRHRGYDLVDWHHCEDFNDAKVRDSVAGLPVINSTDCRPVLNPGPDRTRKMAKVALNKGTHFNVYDWDGDKIDEKVIQVLGEEIKAASVKS